MTAAGDGPPQQLVRALVDGPSRVTGFDWHPSATSTNALAAAAAARGAPQWHVVGADVQTAGRGRAGRIWSAPAGTALLLSVVLRPRVPSQRLPLLPLLAGMAVAEVSAPHVAAAPGAQVGLKWPNDVLARGGALAAARGHAWHKVAGVLVEGPQPGVAIVGIGCNVDWRGAPAPAVADGALAPAALTEVAGVQVDRWRVLAALLGVLGNRYDRWQEAPGAFLDDYRRWCTTLGQPVVVSRPAAAPLRGMAVGVADDGALEVRDEEDRTVRVSAGDVTHVRPSGPAPA